MKKFFILLSRAVIKGVSGFFIVPLEIFFTKVKPKVETASRPVKVFVGFLLVPITAFLYFAVPWWNDFEIDK